MILDQLKNADSYKALSPEIAAAFDYLRRTDFSKTPDGRQEIDGDRVYAIVQRYRSKPSTEAKWEAHRRYLDVQYIAEGVERIGYAPLKDGLAVEHDYDSQKDYVLYRAQGDLLLVPAGSFAVFGPQDVHAPCLATGGPETSGDVCKVVVKCRVAE